MAGLESKLWSRIEVMAPPPPRANGKDLEMKLFAYTLREFDELEYLEQCSREMGFEFGWTSERPTLENACLAEGYDGINIITNPMNRELLTRFADLGVHGIATRSVGVDHIDMAAARDLGMRVGHAAYPPEGVADFTVMLMLMAARRMKLVLGHNGVQKFDLKGKIGMDLNGATVGIIGTGRIGAAVARRLAGFGCKMLAYDPYPNEAVAQLADYVDLDTLLAGSDVITLHAPATAENNHMLDASAFAKMKRGVLVVNAARGSLIDTQALIDAIESGHVGGAALDTIEGEGALYYYDCTLDILPNRDRAILSAFPNVLVSPHMAFYTQEDVKHMVQTTSSALVAFANGQETPYEVR